MYALLLAAALAPTFPLTLSGDVCVAGTTSCSPALVTLQADHTGNFTVIILARVMGGPLQWAHDPATGRVVFLLAGKLDFSKINPHAA